MPQWLKDYLDGVVQLGIGNPVVGGYYTFDEPAIQQVPNHPTGFKKEFQINIYNYIRNQDPDRWTRPISIANTLRTLTGSDIDYSMSNDAQDIFLIDQYFGDVADHGQLLTRWRDHG